MTMTQEKPISSSRSRTKRRRLTHDEALRVRYESAQASTSVDTAAKRLGARKITDLKLLALLKEKGIA